MHEEESISFKHQIVKLDFYLIQWKHTLNSTTIFRASRGMEIENGGSEIVTRARVYAH